jgi:hypothetical protein
MTPAKLSRKHKNRLLTYAKAVMHRYHDGLQNEAEHLDVLHDLAMRCYSEGWTHGEAAAREAATRTSE